MSTKLNALLNQANEAAEASGIDMNEAQKGGGGSRLLPEGYAFGRIVEYVEYGKQPQEFAGQAKDPALEFHIGFALYGTGYQDESGNPAVIRTWPRAISRNEKSGAFKLFKALNWKGTAKSFAQLLGSTILVKIEHKPKSKTDSTPVSRMNMEGFLPPLDPVSRQPYPIPEAADDLYQLFLWDRPSTQAWEALHVPGNWDDGQSKNRTQERILGALDFQGSPLQLLLGGAVPALPEKAAGSPVAAPQTAPAAPVVPTPAQAPVAPVTPAVPVVAPVAPVLPVLPA